MASTPEERSEFGRVLREAREAAGLSRRQLAARVGLDASYLYRIETGDRGPSRETLLALADSLQVDDEGVNRWLQAGGFAAMPVLTAVRAAIRTRGAVRTRGAPRQRAATDASSWSSGVWAQRLTAIGLREGNIERLLKALETADLGRQDRLSGALGSAFVRVAEALESPVRTAVVPAAGSDQRLLASHVIQRMLLDVVAEASESGISRIVLVLAPGMAEGLYAPLRRALDLAVVPVIDLLSTEQVEPDGLGAAVLRAADRLEGAPFAVLLPDDVVRERRTRLARRELRRMIEAFEKLPGAHLLATVAVPRSKMAQCGVAHLGRGGPLAGVRPVTRLVEKPDPQSAICASRSSVGIVGRYLLQPGVIDALRELRGRGRGPIELTDAIDLLCRRGAPVYAYEIEAERRDLGAVVERAAGMMADA